MGFEPMTDGLITS